MTRCLNTKIQESTHIHAHTHNVRHRHSTLVECSRNFVIFFSDINPNRSLNSNVIIQWFSMALCPFSCSPFLSHIVSYMLPFAGIAHSFFTIGTRRLSLHLSVVSKDVSQRYLRHVWLYVLLCPPCDKLAGLSVYSILMFVHGTVYVVICGIVKVLSSRCFVLRMFMSSRGKNIQSKTHLRRRLKVQIKLLHINLIKKYCENAENGCNLWLYCLWRSMSQECEQPQKTRANATSEDDGLLVI